MAGNLTGHVLFSPGDCSMSRLASALCALAILTTLAPVGSAHQSRPRRVAGGAGDEPLTIEGAFVEVPVVVADRSGRYVAGLGTSDFDVTEDGVTQQVAFCRSDRVPIHVALVLDTSSSTRDSLDDIQEAAADFVDQLHPGDEVMVASFDADVRVLQNFTSDRGRLRKAIGKTETRQGTKLYDAVLETLRDRMRRVEGRKAIVLLSDGEDSRSESRPEESFEACVESDVAVYGIRYPGGSRVGPGRPSGGSKKKDKGWHIPGVPRIPGLPRLPGVRWPLASSAWQAGGDFMEEIASLTGGRVRDSRSIRDLPALFRDLVDELSHVYVVGYDSTNPASNGGYRRIAVRVTGRPDLAVRHRPGYVAG
jgi:Ca-activated chloride channel homolog